MRKITFVLLLFIIATLLNACDSSKPQGSIEENAITTTDTTSASIEEKITPQAVDTSPRFSELDTDYQIGNIYMGDSHEKAYEILGNPVSSQSSIYFSLGKSYILNYEDILVTYCYETTDNPDADFVYDISTSSAAITGPRGIKVGQEVKEVLEKFGQNADDIDFTETKTSKTLYSHEGAFYMIFFSDIPNDGRVLFSDDRDDGVIQFEVYFSEGKVTLMHLF